MLNRPPHWFVVAIIYHARNPRRNIDISKTLASCSEGGRFFSPKHARALPHIALKIQKPLLPGKPVRKLPLLDVPEHDICQESESSKWNHLHEAHSTTMLTIPNSWSRFFALHKYAWDIFN